MTCIKFDLLSLSPTLVQNEIFNALTLQDKATLTSVSKSYCSIFQNDMKATKFLQLITHGRRRDAEQLLIKNIELLSIRVNITDYSNRTFKEITAFEYAFWARDVHTCRMLLKYMDKEIKNTMLRRCKEITLNGLIFSMNNQIISKSKHYSFKPLQQALIEYRDSNLEAFDEAKKTLIKAQMEVPAYVVQEFFRLDRPFDSTLSLNEILPEISLWEMKNWYQSRPLKQKEHTAMKLLTKWAFPLLAAANFGIQLYQEEDRLNPSFLLNDGGAAIFSIGALYYIVKQIHDHCLVPYYDEKKPFIRNHPVQLDLDAINQLNTLTNTEIKNLLEQVNLMELNSDHNDNPIQSDLSQSLI